MKEAVEKIKERLEEKRINCDLECASYNNKSGTLFRCADAKRVAYINAIEIVDQVSEECVPDINVGNNDEYISRTEVLKLIEDIKCNDDIPKNYGTLLDIMQLIRKLPSAAVNDGWTPVSDHLPEIEEYYKPFWVTILLQDRGKKFYYVRKATWNQYDKRWEWSNAKAVSDKTNIIAWKEYEIPAPYRPIK